MARTKLTPALQAAICRDLEIAVPLKHAAQANGVSEVTLHRWIGWGESGKTPYVDFVKAVTRARSKAVVKLSRKAQAGGKGSGAATWFLERRYRDEYGPVQRLEHSGPEGKPIDHKLKIEAEVGVLARNLAGMTAAELLELARAGGANLGEKKPETES